ncbi:MAG: hypothetical protein WAK17_06435 [Candidatus Nitrosopolaris sp.]
MQSSLNGLQPQVVDISDGFRIHIEKMAAQGDLKMTADMKRATEIQRTLTHVHHAYLLNKLG